MVYIIKLNCSVQIRLYKPPNAG